MRHCSLDSISSICRKQNIFDEPNDESEQSTEDFELPINPYDFYFNNRVFPSEYDRKRRWDFKLHIVSENISNFILHSVVDLMLSYFLYLLPEFQFNLRPNSQSFIEAQNPQTEEDYFKRNKEWYTRMG